MTLPVFSIPYDNSYTSSIEFKTQINEKMKGKEQRYPVWTYPKRTFALKFDKNFRGRKELEDFFISVMGQRWRRRQEHLYCKIWQQYINRKSKQATDSKYANLLFDFLSVEIFSCFEVVYRFDYFNYICCRRNIVHYIIHCFVCHRAFIKCFVIY